MRARNVLLWNGEEPSGQGVSRGTRCLKPINIWCRRGDERGERIRKISSLGKFFGSAKAAFRAYLHPNQHWNHDGALGGLLEEEARHIVRYGIFDVIKVNRAHPSRGILNRFLDDDARLVQQVLRFAQVHEPARNDVGRLTQFAVHSVYTRDNHKHSVFRKYLPVAKHHFLHTANRESVYHNRVRWRLFFVGANCFSVRADVYKRAVIRDDNIFFRSAERHREVSVLAKHIVVAVEWNEEAVFDLPVDPREFLLVAVPRRMHI